MCVSILLYYYLLTYDLLLLLEMARVKRTYSASASMMLKRRKRMNNNDESMTKTFLEDNPFVWDYIVKHLLDVGYEPDASTMLTFDTAYDFRGDEKKRLTHSRIGSHESMVFNPLRRMLFERIYGGGEQHQPHGFFVDFEEVWLGSVLGNLRHPFIQQFTLEETWILDTLNAFKSVVSNVFFVSKRVMEWASASLYSAYKNDNVLKSMLRGLDSYYGVLKWGPVWVPEIDEQMTSETMVNVLFDAKERAVNQILTEGFMRTDGFETTLDAVCEYEKEVELFRAREHYIRERRVGMLKTLTASNTDDIKEESIVDENALLVFMTEQKHGVDVSLRIRENRKYVDWRYVNINNGEDFRAIKRTNYVVVHFIPN